jgi:hypothetical protein
MFPIIGNPFGPGGYGGRFEAHLLRTTARTIAVATAAKPGPRYFSGLDMLDSSGWGKGAATEDSKTPGVHLRTVTAPV